MTDNTDKQLELMKEELEQYKAEKERIRKYVGQIGGKNESKTDRIINIIFIIMLVALFVIDFLHIMGVDLLITTTFTIILAILLVSLKIIWMIHKQSKVNHFQFWVLNSIEFRLNDLAKKVNKINRSIESLKKEET